MDDRAILFDDPDHSLDEERFLQEKQQQKMRSNMKNPTTEETMREEYDIEQLNPRKNPYAARLKQQVTMNMKVSTVTYFKNMAEESGVPYQILINIYLDDCVKKGLRIQFG